MLLTADLVALLVAIGDVYGGTLKDVNVGRVSALLGFYVVELLGSA